ncbi:MAG: SPOR domain-containing protein [Armatimonadota bacterium]
MPPSPPAPLSPPVGDPAIPVPGPQAERAVLYMVQVGPVSDQERAAEIVRELSLAGFDPAVNTIYGSSAPEFQVVSETISTSVAERRIAVLTALGFDPELRTFAGGLAQLRFGPFASRSAAEVLARRVRLTGYSYAAVVREGGTLYIVTLGPHSQAAVAAITGMLSSRFRAMIPVAARPID